MTDEAPTGQPRPPRSAEPIDTRLVRRLADILRETELTEIEVERGELRVRVARKAAAAPASPVVYAAAPTPQPHHAAPPASASIGDQAIAAAEGAPLRETAPPAAGDLVKSPMVGTVYLQPQPGAAPFIKVGDTVAEGQTLVLVEAMKTMNPIPAPRAGKIVQLLVGDAQPVEYGEPLVVLA